MSYITHLFVAYHIIFELCELMKPIQKLYKLYVATKISVITEITENFNIRNYISQILQKSIKETLVWFIL